MQSARGWLLIASVVWLAAGLAGTSIGTVLALAAATAANVCLAASLGLLCSVLSRTANRAFLKLFLGSAAWVFVCGSCLACGGSSGTAVMVGAAIPPVPMTIAGFAFERSNEGAVAGVVGLGILASAVAAAALLPAATDSFAQQVRPTREQPQSDGLTTPPDSGASP